MRARASFARLGALVLVASTMLGGAACGLVAGLDKLSFQDPAACAEPCDDLDPCTESDCLVDGACHGQAVADGPSMGDPIGNCQTIACVSGVAKITVDDTDAPADDGNPCTDDACAEGTPGHPAKPDGGACVNGGAVAGVCSAGMCAAKCTQDAECDDHNACTTDACDLLESRCRSTPLADGTQTPGAVSMPGNCRTRRCLAGVDIDAVDDLDLIPSSNDCITATCTDGTLNLPPNAPGTPCMTTGGQICDGAGACKKTNGTVCLANAACASGDCVDGVCCGSTCAGTCMSCKVTGSLGTCINVPSGQTDSNATVTCVAPSVCNGAGACKKTNGQTCAAGTECVSAICADGVCCNTTCTTACMTCNLAVTTGTCSNIPSGQPDPSPANACVGTSLCDGTGVCKLGSGAPCTLASQCFSNLCMNSVCQ